MIHWTTPTITVEVEGVDLTGKEVYVSFRPYNDSTRGFDMQVTPELDGENSVISVQPSQADMGRLTDGKCKVQVNWVDQSGARMASDIGVISVTENLLDKTLFWKG